LHGLRSRDREGHEGDHPRAPNRGRDLALMLGAVSRDPAGHQLPAIGDEVLQQRLILVIDLESVIAAKLALLAPPEASLLVAAVVGRSARPATGCARRSLVSFH